MADETPKDPDPDRLAVVFFEFAAGGHMTFRMPRRHAVATVEAWMAFRRYHFFKDTRGVPAGPAPDPFVGGEGWAAYLPDVVGASCHEPSDVESPQARMARVMEEAQRHHEKTCQAGRGEEWRDGPEPEDDK